MNDDRDGKSAMNEDVVRFLSKLIQRHPNAVANPSLCKALLLDYCGIYKSECRVLANAVDEGIPSELMRGPGNVPSDVWLGRFVQQLVKNRVMPLEAAEWGVQQWAAALCRIESLPNEEWFQPTVEVTSPKGGETWALGSRQTIRVRAVAKEMTQFRSVTVHLYEGERMLETINEDLKLFPPIHGRSTGNSTSFDWEIPWTIPEVLKPASNYKIRITLHIEGAREPSTSFSKAPFSLVPPPVKTPDFVKKLWRVSLVRWSIFAVYVALVAFWCSLVPRAVQESLEVLRACLMQVSHFFAHLAAGELNIFELIIPCFYTFFILAAWWFGIWMPAVVGHNLFKMCREGGRKGV